MNSNEKNFILLFLLLIVTLSLKAQSYYTVIGESGWGPDVIWKFKVVDDYNDKPLRNAKVEMLDGNYKIFSLRTNEEGIAVILINDMSKIRSGWDLRITDQNYSYSKWEMEIDQWYFIESANRTKILKLAHSNGQLVNWTDGMNMPKDSKIANDLSIGRYGVHDLNTANFHYAGPAFFEYDIRLEYRVHPRDQVEVRINDSRSDIHNNDRSNYPSINQNEQRVPNGWNKMPAKYDAGRIRISYVKGDTELMLVETDGGNYMVAKNGYYIDEYGNGMTFYEKDAFTKEEAMKIIYNYMGDH